MNAAGAGIGRGERARRGVKRLPRWMYFRDQSALYRVTAVDSRFERSPM